MIRETPLILAPGPVTVCAAVREAAAGPTLFHRSAEFRALHRRCLTHLDGAFGCEGHRSLIIPGSGSSALESVLLSLVGSDDRLLVIANGHFGDRIRIMAERAGLDVRTLSFRWGDRIDVNQVQAALHSDHPTTVFMVALETSTGMRNPVRKVGEACGAAGARFYVDAVSAYFAEDLDLTADGVDVCVTVPNKALEGVPGLALLSVRADLLDGECHRAPLTMDLSAAARAAEAGETVFTPPIPLYWALDAAFGHLAEETVARRRERYRRHSERLRAGLAALRLHVLVSNPALQARAITTVVMRPQEARQLERGLHDNGFQVYARSYEERSAGQVFVQFSVMGEVSADDLEAVMQVAERVVGPDA